MIGFVYILKDGQEKFYIGSTGNLEKRLRQHSQGNTKTTNRMKSPRLIFSQEYNTLEQARKVERKIKKLKRRDYIEKIIRDGFIKTRV